MISVSAQVTLINESFDYALLSDGDSLVANTDWQKDFGDDMTYNELLDLDGTGGSGRVGAAGGGINPFNSLQQSANNFGVESTVFSGYIGSFGSNFGGSQMIMFETVGISKDDGYGFSVGYSGVDDELVFSSRFGTTVGTDILIDATSLGGIQDIRENIYYFEGSYDSANSIVEFDLFDGQGGTLLGNSSVTNITYEFTSTGPTAGLNDDLAIRSGGQDVNFVVDGLTLQTVPEPVAYPLLTGVIAFCSVMIRRNR